VSPNDNTTRPLLAVGVEAGSTGTVLVSGENSSIALSMSAPADPGDASDLLRGPGIAIGLKGAGAMTVQDKATVTLDGDEAFISVGVGNHLDPDDTTQYPAATLTLTTDAKIVLTDTAGGDGGLIVGDFKGGTGTVNVGEGATISIVSEGGATVGEQGKGTLNVQNGGKVEIESDNFNNLVIGETAGSYGKVAVNGAGSQIVTTGTDNTVQVGYRGEGKLEVTGGGVVSTLELDIGRFGTGTVNITGPGSKVIASNDGGLFSLPYADYAGFVTVGYNSDSSGTVTITDGGQLEIRPGKTTDTHEGALSIAHGAGSTGTVTVEGAGSAINSLGPDSNLIVGRLGVGTLTVTKGGQTNSGFLAFGMHAGGDGTGLVSGDGSAIRVTGDQSLNVGRFGHGTLTIEAGGYVSGTYVHIGHKLGGSGEVVITGAESSLIAEGTNGGTISVGRYGSGTLTIAEGGLAQGDWVNVGSYYTAIGTVLVTGTGSRFVSVDDEMNIGRYGKGTLTVEKGGSVQGSYVHAGHEASGDGTIIVTGAGSRIVTAGDDDRVEIGRVGSGTLTVEKGGLVQTQSFTIGQDGTGDVLVMGLGSKIVTTGTDNTVQVGYLGEGKLDVTGGGLVSTLDLEIGRFGKGTVNITGPGSKVIASNDGGVFSGQFGWEAGFVGLGAGDFGDSMVEGGQGVLNVTGGGTLEIRNGTANQYAIEPGMIVARAFGSTGVVTVEGKDSNISSIQISQAALADPGNDRFGPFLQIGRAGEATMTISGNALVSLAGDNSFVQVGRGNADEIPSPDPVPVLPQSVLDIKGGGDLVIDGVAGFAGMNIGQEANGNGLVKVDGAGSTLSIIGGDAGFHVGEEGGGELQITGGGMVIVVGGATKYDSGFMSVGSATGSTGLVTVSGIDSTLSVTGTDAQISVGGNGEDTVPDDGGTGTLLVTGGAVVNTLFLQIAQDGTGVTTISNGGTVVASNAFGSFTGDDGVTLLDDGGFVRVGRNDGSDGTLKVVDGGMLSITGTSTADDAGLQIARNVGSVGTVLVDGADSIISIVQDPDVIPGEDEGGPSLQIGRAGKATMTISDKALVSLAGDGSFVQVSRGNANEFDNPEDAPVLPQSVLDIKSGGDLIVDGLTGFAGMSIGEQANGDGKVVVTGEGSSISINAGTEAFMHIGNGSLKIADKGTFVLSGEVYASIDIGGYAGNDAHLEVTDAGSSFVLTGNGNRMNIGFGGTGSLTVGNGGLVKVLALDVGLYSAGDATVTVTGPGSALIVSNDSGVLHDNAAGSLSLAGNATLEVLDGGLVEVRAGTQNPDAVHPGLDIGFENSVQSNGRVRVSGDGSLIRISQTAFSGEVFAGGGAALALYAGMALVTVENNGQIIVEGPGSSVRVGEGVQIASHVPTLEVKTGGSVLIDGQDKSAALLIAGNVDSAGAVAVSGPASTLTVTGDTYAVVHVGYGGDGVLSVTSAGTLVAGVSGDSISGDSVVFENIDVQIFSHGTLDGGGGTIVGDLYMDVGSRLRAGEDSVTQMNVQGNLLVFDATVEIDAKGNELSDLYDVSGQVDIWSGVFEFSFLEGYLPLDGDGFTFLHSDIAVNVDLNNMQYILNNITAGGFFGFAISNNGNNLTFQSFADTEESDGLLYRGSDSPDTFTATKGQDELYGRDGDDILAGSAGNDFFIGGFGDDSLDGGPGADEFFYDASFYQTKVANQLVSASGETGDLISNFDATIDKFLFSLSDFSDFQPITAANFASIVTEYDGTNAGGAAYVVDSLNHLIYDDNGNADGYTVLATVDLADGSPAISASNLQTV
jgi:T5SS/PEP-CTERM-associated repeat protein